jgi:hypothetical protein
MSARLNSTCLTTLYVNYLKFDVFDQTSCNSCQIWRAWLNIMSYMSYFIFLTKYFFIRVIYVKYNFFLTKPHKSYSYHIWRLWPNLMSIICHTWCFDHASCCHLMTMTLSLPSFISHFILPSTTFLIIASGLRTIQFFINDILSISRDAWRDGKQWVPLRTIGLQMEGFC